MQNSGDDEVPSGILKEQQNKKENWVNVELFLMWYVVFYNTKPGWVNIYENDPVYIHWMHNNNSKQGRNNIRIYEKYPDFMKRCVCVFTWQHILYSLPVCLCSSTDRWVYRPGRSPPCNQWTLLFLLHLLSKKTEGDKPSEKRQDMLFHTDRQRDRERQSGSRYLDRAEYSSYKQVGVLVDIQDGVGRGRVGTGRCWHHTSHGAFERIYWYGAVQAITADRGFDVILFAILYFREDRPSNTRLIHTKQTSHLRRAFPSWRFPKGVFHWDRTDYQS